MNIKKAIVMCLVGSLLLSNSAFSSIVAAEGKDVEKSHNIIVGAPSQMVWTFTANKKGIYKLLFSYARPWEKTTPALKTLVYTVEVKDEKNTDSKLVILKANAVNTVKIGQKFNITLEENLSAGYSWSYKADSAAIQLIDVKSTETQVSTYKKIVKVGEKFNITLEENISTGYSWSYKSSSAAIKLIGEKSKETNDNIVGAPSQKVWTFTANKKGIYKLQFSYARSKTIPAFETVIYIVEVKDEKNTDSKLVILKANEVNTVKVGEKFNITLEENISTGYSWSYKSSSAAIKLIGEKSKETNKETNDIIVGASSQKVWTFTVNKKGIYKLQFSYARPWEKTTPALKTVIYTVEVK